MLAGTEGDFETQAVIPIEKMLAMYNKISSSKVMMRRIGAEHGQMLYFADGYVTAWFMWQLQGDEEAAKAFKTVSCFEDSNKILKLLLDDSFTNRGSQLECFLKIKFLFFLLYVIYMI